MIVFLFLAVNTLMLVYVYVKWRYTYWAKLGVPCPQPTFFFGNVLGTLTMSTHIALLCEEWYNTYKNTAYSGYYKLLTPAITLHDIDLVKDVLIKDHFSFHANEQNFNKRFDPLMAYNPFVATDDSWRKGRSVLTPLSTVFKVRALHPHIVHSCEEMRKYLRTLPPNSDIEAKKLSSLFSTQNVIRASFSIDPQCFTNVKSEFRDMGRKIFQPSLFGGIKLMLMSICPMLRDVLPFGFIPFNVDKWFRNLVHDLREERTDPAVQRQDLFQTLLNSVEKHDISDDELASYALTLFVEGYETSSSVLSFAIYEVARHPDIQERLYEEISDILAKYDGEFTFDALEEMTYLDCVMRESMRIDGIAPLISRVCTKPYTLPKLPGQDKPVTIPVGTPVQIVARAIHMDPEHYPDPEVFDPSRFEYSERKSRNNVTFLPFGEGPRMCTGIRFAMSQTKAGLMSIVRDYKITISPRHKPIVFDNRSFLYQARDGLLVNFTPRSS